MIRFSTVSINFSNTTSNTKAYNKLSVIIS